MEASPFGPGRRDAPSWSSLGWPCLEPLPRNPCRSRDPSGAALQLGARSPWSRGFWYSFLVSDLACAGRSY